MADENPRRRQPSTRARARGHTSLGRRLLGLLGLVVVVGGGLFLWRVQLSREAARGPEIPDREPAAVEPPATGDRSVVLVFPEWDALGYVTEPRQIPSRSRVDEDLLAVMRSLCAGPTVSGAVSALPAGTRPLAAFYDPEEHGVVLDFSAELVTRHPGGGASETATLTSILRTVALNFPDAEQCWILVEGAQVETLAGHVTLDQPFAPRRWL